MKFDPIRKAFTLFFTLVVIVIFISSCSSSKGARKCNGNKMIKTNMN